MRLMQVFQQPSYTLQSILTLVGMICACIVYGQNNAQKDSILILGNEYAEFIQKEEHTVHKLMHDVKLQHGSDTLYCDSAFFFTHINSVEAFGNVVVRQADGTEAFADYMRYTGNNKVVYMRANGDKEVQLIDAERNSLWSKEIAYNLQTKIGNYRNGGQLQNEATVLISDRAQYNLNTKEARFTGNVVVDDPEYNVVSKDLGYNTETKLVRFFGPSVVVNEESILKSRSGTYDSKNKIAHFTERSSIQNQAQYIEADTLDYDRTTGFGIGRGNVISIDTTQKSVLFAGYVQYNELTKVMWSYMDPVMKKMNGKDSMFLRADTFYSSPMPDSIKVLSAQDSLQLTAEILQSSTELSDSTLVVDSLLSPEDSVSDSLNFFPEDKLLPDSLQLSSDSIPELNQLHVADSVSLKAIVPVIISDSTLLKPPSDTTLPADGITHIKKQMDVLVYADSAAQSVDTTRVANKDEDYDAYPEYEGNIQPNVDTSGPRYFLAYHNVLLWSDSLQGKCDSLRYTESDSLLTLFTAPVLWPKDGQMSGEVIMMKADTESLREIIIPREGIMINRSGPEQAGMFDQVQGNYIHGYLRNNELDSLIAEGSAASIYFVTDEDSAYVGGSEATADRIEILFEDEKIDKIYYRSNVEQKMTPMEDVVPNAFHLNRFKWLESDRPKDFKEFLKGKELPPVPEL